jgi:hypothetical protein
VVVVSASDRVSALRSRLLALSYPIAAGDFVRFRSVSQDDDVSGIVRSLSAESVGGYEEFRRGLSAEGVETLRLWAMRRTLQCRRQSSLGLTHEALDGFALLPSVTDVPWDSWLKAALYVARSLGGDPEFIRQRFNEVAREDAMKRFDVALEAMNRVETLSQCHVAEVQTSYGVGFVEQQVFRGTPTLSFLGAPRQGDNQIGYQPTTNLAQLGASLADALDASGRVITGPLGQDQLPASALSLTVPGSYLTTTGCLSFIADTVEGASALTAFVAELPADTDVAELADAATKTNDQVAAFDDQRLIVLSPQPSFDENDDDIDLSGFEELARNVIKDPATR